MAAAAGDRLLQTGIVGQGQESEDVPALAVNMYVPAALNDSKMGKYQIKIGYAAEFINQLLRSPETRKIILKERSFLDGLYRTIPKIAVKRMDGEQVERKKGVIKNIVDQLVRGVPVPDGLKVNEIMGNYDPLLFSFERKQEVEDHAKKLDTTGLSSSIGAFTLPRREGKGNERVFSVNMSHRLPFYRENELVRYDNLADKLINLRESE